MSKLEERFAAHFGRAAAVLAEAPGRLEILGNHTDYNQGITLSCAVGNNTRCALRPNGGTWCRVKDFRSGDEMTFEPKKGRYVMITITKNTDNPAGHVAEVEIYEK